MITPPFLMFLLLPCFVGSWAFDTIWPVVAWLAVLVVYGLTRSKR